RCPLLAQSGHQRCCAPSHLASQIQQHTRRQRQCDQNADRHVIESVHGVAPASPASPSLTLSTMRARLIQVKIVVSLVHSSFNYSIELNSRAGALCTHCAGGGALYERI